ncbi:signal transduction histidine kinase [Methylobacterium sp. BE186]|uniref:sensor histidine kinase n=1 Tax=Methylobacterium sp. BE186 TaxID=2817715 RepID=UPI00285C3ADB|nr:HAMP domain-containing sensor histidine kinase [Methylobacterium sp. BE186]MDR7037609.1 signal transduction histidine kinase [Methylobacterium sp. BE186]
MTLPPRPPRPPAPRRWLGGPGSLQRRLLLAAGAFLGVALIAAGLSIGFVLHRFVRGQVDGRLDDRLLSLVSDLRPGPGGALSLGRDRDGPPFDRPRSGWYWQVGRGGARLGSASLEGRDLSLPEIPRRRRDDGPAPADGTGPWGEGLILRILTVPGAAGEPPTIVAASAPKAALRGPVLDALRTLALCLGVIGLFLFAGVLVQVRLGLRPLRRLRDQLTEIRAGALARLPERQPAEIRPLVCEMNALLDQNAANLEHARAHVANLAHSLKTPLATLSMALNDAGSGRDGSLARLVDGMDRRVRHHLRRARAAAIGGPARSRVDLAAHVADLRLVLTRIHADRDIAFASEIPDGLGVACDPQDLDEMLGNLIENACQWCRRRVRVEARRAGAEVVVRVADDGPGLDGEAAEAVLKRGRRLDESQPGNGFGLPIALELAELYGGSLALGPSDLGGLEVRLTLPA